ncbi:metallophosphoesterase [Ktedonosporobacter rubrisoli]|uniref:Phosphoesterase n=1 Tax=Ktedonosporobacter rubrisoli TaxID=2509675 RepID=A0A4P6JRH4_KTERU|nr:metallophosphoesterase family protein [Ktedonosporobacter rubrisoli]QBD77903.1 metallophosphoesterase [Ktedonosporobacter rubrisoli]
MRIALISDIHGNLVALEAVLADIARERVEQIVCLGDVAGTGPQPREVIEKLRALQIPIVMGNVDAWLIEPQLSADADEDTRKIEEIDLWCAQQLSQDERAYLRSFLPTIQLDLLGTKLLCCHGSPQSNLERIDAETPVEELRRMLASYSTEVLAAGHTHVQLLRRHEDMILCNPGSVGLAYSYSPSLQSIYNPAWGEYAIISANAEYVGIELRRVPFDVEAFVKAMLSSGMPHAQWCAADWKA